MIAISKEQANERYESLPDRLKDVLFSAPGADAVWQVCERNHLTDDKSSVVARLTGRVILGFIHPEDLGREIANELQINSQISAAISAEIDKKIFAPISEDLKKVYAPASASSWGDSNVIDLKPSSSPVSIPQSASLPPLSAGIDSSKTEMLKNFAPQGASMPTADAGPMILHEETKLKPAAGGASRSLGGLFGFGKKTELSGDVSGAAAQVRFGGENLSAPAFTPKTPMNPSEQSPRVVHYTEFRTPVSPVSGAGSSSIKDGPISLSAMAQPVAPKPISQGPAISPPLPKPPMPPKPPAPPQSYSPPQVRPADSPFSIPMSQISQSKIEEIKPLAGKVVPPEPLKIQPKPVPEKPKDETIVDLRTFQIGLNPATDK